MVKERAKAWLVREIECVIDDVITLDGKESIIAIQRCLDTFNVNEDMPLVDLTIENLAVLLSLVCDHRNTVYSNAGLSVSSGGMQVVEYPPVAS